MTIRIPDSKHLRLRRLAESLGIQAMTTEAVTVDKAVILRSTTLARVQLNGTALPAIVQAQRPNVESIREQALAGVNLTSEQKSRLAQVQQETRTQIEGTLTSEQLSQFKAAIVSGQDFRTAATNVNLSQEQKTKIRAIMKLAMQKGEAILTPAQQQQVRQNLRGLQNRNRSAL